MAFKGIFLACLLLVAVVSAQGPTGSFSVTGLGSNSVDVGTWTDFFLITASENPTSTVTVNVQSDSTEISFSATSFTFGPNVRSHTFRATSNTPGSYQIDFTRTDGNEQFTDVIGSVGASFSLREITIDRFPSQTYVNQPSEPIQIVVSTAPTSDLAFVPNVNNTAVTISPNPVVIRAGTKSASFTFITRVEVFTDTLWWTITGNQLGLYEVEDLTNSEVPRTMTYNTVRRDVEVASRVSDVLVGTTAGPNGFYVYTPIVSNGTFTITPQAADVTFTPASALVGENGRQVFLFNYSASTPGNREVYVTVSGGSPQADYLPIESDEYITRISVPKRQVTVNVGSVVRLNTNTTYMSVSIPAPANGDLTVTFTAGNVRFSQQSVQFTKENGITAYTVALHGTNNGPDDIQFALSGTDADWYEEIGSVEITVQQSGSFITPQTYYKDIPLWVGVESEKIPIRASVSPIAKDGVTLTPSAPNLIFNPSVLTFSNGTEQQYFTITPLYTNNYDDDVPAGYSSTITWLVSGADYALFEAPAPTQVNVAQREFQAVWSSHLWTDNSTTSTERHLQKTYKVWVSANYVGKDEEVTVTPVSPYWRFKPSVLKFTEKDTRIELEATVTGLGDGRIDYIIGGKHGGLYTPLASQDFDLALRPLKIVAAEVSPDERTRASVYVADNDQVRYTFNPSVLENAHTRSFLIRSFALPDREVTITPHATHVKFSPSKITIKPSGAVKRIDWHPEVGISDGADLDYEFNATGGYLEANFSAEALAPGTHYVTFELTGADSHYYTRIPRTPMTFNLVSRGGGDEKLGVSSSSFLFPSFVVVAVAAIALVL